MVETLKADPKAILEALNIFVLPGQVVELRAPKAGPRRKATIFGYYDSDHLGDLAVAAAKIKAPGIYTMLNPVKNDLLARCCNRTMEADKGETTGDTDITSRQRLLIDVDATRPAGISSTDEEKALALGVAKEVKANLSSRGWPAPVTGDSGNGYHLLYRIDLPVDDGGLVKRVLETLNQLHGTDQVKIDTSVFNPARITKLFGTISCKGDNTPDRPHRMSKLLTVPDAIEVVPTALLEALAGTPKAAPSKNRDNSESFKTGLPTFDVQAFIDRHGLEASGPNQYDNGGQIWALKACPFRENDGNSCAIIQLSSGAVWCGCQHDTCPGSKGTGNHWTDLRAMKGDYPSDNYGGVFFEEAPPNIWPDDDDLIEGQAGVDLIGEKITANRLESLRWSAIRDQVVPKLKWHWEPYFPEIPFGALVSMPGHGKSILMVQIAVAVATGLSLFGFPTGEPGGVVIVALEDSKHTLHRRIKAAVEGYGIAFTEEHHQLLDANLRVLYRSENPLAYQSPEAHDMALTGLMDEIITEAGTITAPMAITFIDTFNSVHGGDENSAQQTRPIVAAIYALHTRLGCSVWVLHHLKKTGTARNAPPLVERMDPDLIRGSGAFLGAVRGGIQFGWIYPKEALKAGLEPDGAARR